MKGRKGRKTGQVEEVKGKRGGGLFIYVLLPKTQEKVTTSRNFVKIGKLPTQRLETASLPAFNLFFFVTLEFFQLDIE